MASINFDQTAADAMLKQMYDVPAMENLSYSDRPFLALVRKQGGIGGNGAKIPLLISNSQAFAPTVVAAQASLVATDILAFLVTPKTLLSLARIAGITIEAAMTSKQSFASSVKVVVDAAVARCANGVASGLYGDGSGKIGTISSINTGTGAVVLTEPEEITQFEVNQVLQAYTSGGAQRAGVAYIISINRDAGTFVVSTTLGGSGGAPAAFAATDGLYTFGTFNAQLDGLQRWLSTSATPGNLFGVNRDSDKVRLAGVYYDGSGQSVKDALVNIINLIAREGGRPSHVFLSYNSYIQLALDLGSNVIYTDLTGPGKISFTGFKFMSSRGEVTVVPDVYAPPKKAFVLTMDSWTLLHVNEGNPIFLDENSVGQVLRTVESFDGREVRIKHYGNLACNAPGYNGICDLSA
jgi:hypothetical protein